MTRTTLCDRLEAGLLLAERMQAYRDKQDCVVVALPRGGVIPAYEIAMGLGLPLDVLVVRKLGVPGQPELAMGAIARGVTVLNEGIVAECGLTQADIARVAASEQAEVERRERAYRSGRAPVDCAGRTVILVDDGVATGATLRAGIAALRKLGAKRIVVAAAVAPADTAEQLRKEVDEVVVLMTPYPFVAISCWYEEFPQVTDVEVREALSACGHRRAS